MYDNQSRNPLRKISQEFDWYAYLEDHYTVKPTSGDELRICCPKCHEMDYKCYVNPIKGFFHCFKCDFKNGKSSKYDFISFISITENITRGAAIKRLLITYKATTPESLDDAIKEINERKREEKLSVAIRPIAGLPTGAKKLLKGENQPFWDYLTGRGLTEAEVLACNIHCVPDRTCLVRSPTGKISVNIGQRILFPIYGGSNQLVSWLTRAIAPIEKGQQKYIICPDSDMSKTVWPFVPPKTKSVVIVEGIFDALACRRAGIDAYAMFGKHMSKEQIDIFKTWGVEEVTVFFDKRDAKREIIDLVEINLTHIFTNVYVLNQKDWPEKMDAGDCLSLPEGTAMLTSIIADKVHSSSLRYSKWKLEY